MPYDNQTAGKTGHADFVNNPDVQAFLGECQYMRTPSDAEAQQVVAVFEDAPAPSATPLPRFVVASDGSKRDDPFEKKLPSTQIGYVKVSHVLVDLERYSALSTSRFVDPFAVAEVHRNANPVAFTLPGSNILYKGCATVRDSFRLAVFDQLSMVRRADAQGTSVLDTLFKLNGDQIFLSNCPSCGAPHEPKLVLTPHDRSAACHSCGDTNYATDWLRIHDDVADNASNTNAITRFMNVVEHLLLINLIDQVFVSSPRSLAKMAFVLDGPLAIFGGPARLHGRIMGYLHMVNERLAHFGEPPLLLIGLQKQGQVMEHAGLIDRYLSPGKIKLVNDEYRDQHIQGQDAANENFGHETYYGQDFLFKTERGSMFNFAIPYPFSGKGIKRQFAREKAEPARYGDMIARACDLIRYFEMDLYTSAIVPVALAHRHASISIHPGGKVLDVLAQTGLGRSAQ